MQRTHGLRPHLAVVASLIMVAALLSAPAAATGFEEVPVDDWLPELAPSEQLAGPAVVHGTVLDSRERPAGAQVTLLAWPDETIVEGLAEGDQVKLVPVAKAHAARDGSFALRLDPSAPLGQMTSPRGTVDFSLLATRGAERSVFAFSLEAFETADGVQWAEPGSADAGAASTPQVTLNLEGAATAATPGYGATDTVTDKFCTSIHLETYDPVWVLAGQAYTGPNARATFTYSNGAQSTLGVGYSASGSIGSFTSSGTLSRSSTGTLGYPQVNQNLRRYFYTTYRYGRYYVSCSSGGAWPVYWWELRPVSWAAGQGTATPPSTPTANYCSNMLAGGHFTKNTSTAVTWTNGVSIAHIAGVSLSSRTGYTNAASLRHDFVNNGQLCGTGDWPGGTPYQLVGK